MWYENLNQPISIHTEGKIYIFGTFILSLKMYTVIVKKYIYGILIC
jgi:hypothetical protein